MSEQAVKLLQIVLSVLPLVVGSYSIIALIVSIRGIIKARREAYELVHRDFLDLKERVRVELEKEKSDE